MPPDHRPHSRRRAAPQGVSARYANDERAISEIIGYILVFAIISILLVLAMVAFNKLQNDAHDNVTELRAKSAGTRVASLVSKVSLLAESQASTIAVRFVADLPADLEGYDYVVYLEPAGDGHVERVRVNVPAIDLDVTAPLFSADAPSTLSICGGSSGTSAYGGRVMIAFNVDAYANQSCLFLEAAP